MNNVISNLRIHHVALFAEDFEATVAFYEKLGFTKYTGWGNSEKRIQLMDIGNGSYLEIFSADPDSTRTGGRFIHLALAVDDVDAAYAAALAAGATPKMAPKVVSPDASPSPITINCGFVYGLNGEVIEFFRELGAGKGA